MGGRLLIISGPSAGVGKDTILNMFRNAHPDWMCPPSTTTRLPRQGEIHGKDMNFLNREEFEKRVKAGDFFEYFEVAGNLYGTLKEPVLSLLAANKNVVLRKDVQGAIEIKKIIPDAIIVMLMPESVEVLKVRLRRRGSESDDEIARRLELSVKEMSLKNKFDYTIINPEGHPERALADLEKALNF